MIPCWFRNKLKGWQCVGDCKQFIAVNSRLRRKAGPNSIREAMKLYE